VLDKGTDNKKKVPRGFAGQSRGQTQNRQQKQNTPHFFLWFLVLVIFFSEQFVFGLVY
jgi:hypothetical protein